MWSYTKYTTSLNQIEKCMWKEKKRGSSCTWMERKLKVLSLQMFGGDSVDGCDSHCIYCKRNHTLSIYPTYVIQCMNVRGISARTHMIRVTIYALFLLPITQFATFWNSLHALPRFELLGLFSRKSIGIDSLNIHFFSIRLHPKHRNTIRNIYVCMWLWNTIKSFQSHKMVRLKIFIWK